MLSGHAERHYGLLINPQTSCMEISSAHIRLVLFAKQVHVTLPAVFSTYGCSRAWPSQTLVNISDYSVFKERSSCVYTYTRTHARRQANTNQTHTHTHTHRFHRSIERPPTCLARITSKPSGAGTIEPEGKVHTCSTVCTRVIGGALVHSCRKV